MGGSNRENDKQSKELSLKEWIKKPQWIQNYTAIKLDHISSCITEVN